MTYPSDDEKTMELPRWMKLMRMLVMTLLIVSILAMASLIYAAVKIVGAGLDASNASPEFEEMAVNLPETAEPLGVTFLSDGKKVIIYQLNSDYRGQIVESDGHISAEVEFQ